MPSKKNAAASIAADGEDDWVTAGSKKSAGQKKTQTATPTPTVALSSVVATVSVPVQTKPPTPFAPISLAVPSGSAPQAAKDGHAALEQLRIASVTKYDDAKKEIAASFHRFAHALSARENQLLAELAVAQQTEANSLKQRADALQGMVSAHDQAQDSAKKAALVPIEAFRNVARADLPSWNASRFVDNSDTLLHQIVVTGSIFNAPFGGSSTPTSIKPLKAQPAVVSAVAPVSSQPTSVVPVPQPTSVPQVRAIGGSRAQAAATPVAAVASPASVAVQPPATVPSDISSLIRPVGSAQPASSNVSVSAPKVVKTSAVPNNNAPVKKEEDWETPKGQRKSTKKASTN